MRKVWWLAVVVLALLAWKTRTPYAHRFGGYEAGIVLIGAAILAKTATRGALKRCALAAIAIYAVHEEVAFRAAKARVESAPPAQLARLGRHVIAGFRDPAEVEKLAARGAIGGIFVTHHNVKNKTPAEARAMIAAIREHAAHEDFLVAADQEGGAVSRLSPPLPYRPALSAFAKNDTPDALDALREHASAQAEELASLGVDVNFSPVVDLKRDRGFDPLDFHSKIAERAISEDPERVAQVGGEYARAMEAHGVIATLKHFPGLGRAGGDTHHFDVAINAPLAELEATDLHPFRAVLADSHAFLMLGHVALPALDASLPASESRAVIAGLIRDRWGHDGVLVTDDVCMGPFFDSPGGVGEASVRALNAGVDLLLVGYDETQYYRVMAALLDADDAGRLDRAERARSIVRLNRTAEYRSFIRASTIARGID